MNMEKTHWRKNIDSAYISGEDLAAEIPGKGFRKEMNVIVCKQSDAKTFDKNTNKDMVKTALFLKEHPSGTDLPKPVLLNKTNALFFVELTGKEYIEDWENIPVTMYALPDRRHGFVVRFKKFIAPSTATPDAAIAMLNKCTNAETLKTIWGGLSPSEKNLPSVMALKEQLKQKFSAPETPQA